MEKEYNFTNNKAKRQYEFHIDRYTPHVEYIINHENDIFLTHTEVHPALAGKGIGTLLVEKTLVDIEEQNLKLVPLCPFVAGYIKKHPEWMRIVKKNINIR